MTTLDADTQRFLAAHWCTTARAFDNAHSLKASWSGAFGRDVYCHQVTNAGIAWSAPDEPHSYTLDASQWPHLVTWAQLAEHYAAQPASLRRAFKAALDATDTEARRHWDETHRISPNGYICKAPEVVEQLRAEDARHRAAERQFSAAAKAATLNLLPLSDDEPADLIEWAEALA